MDKISNNINISENQTKIDINTNNINDKGSNIDLCIDILPKI